MSTSIQPTVSFEFISGDRPAVRSVELSQHFGLKHSHGQRGQLRNTFHRKT